MLSLSIIGLAIREVGITTTDNGRQKTRTTSSGSGSGSSGSVRRVFGAEQQYGPQGPLVILRCSVLRHRPPLSSTTAQWLSRTTDPPLFSTTKRNLSPFQMAKPLKSIQLTTLCSTSQSLLDDATSSSLFASAESALCLQHDAQ